MREDGHVKIGAGRERAPVDLRERIEDGVWRLRAHESRGPKKQCTRFAQRGEAKRRKELVAGSPLSSFPLLTMAGLRFL